MAPAGIDEAGRGCLFGPVTAAAVILPSPCRIRDINDSKVLSAEVRLRLSAEIKAHAISWSVGWSSVAEIEKINILNATRLAMRRAISGLNPQPDFLLIDAVKLDHPLPQLNLIKGDAQCRSIAAASILAKVARDRLLDRFHQRYPVYDLASNKGYGTPAHLAALEKHGPTSQHRLSFAPVRAIIETHRNDA